MTDATAPETVGLETGQLSARDLAVDHTMAALAGTIRFLLDVTPLNADDVKAEFLAHPEADPEFRYRDLDTDPEILHAMLDGLPIDRVEDATLGTLLRNKLREMRLRVEMLAARDTPDFLTMSIEHFGGVHPGLREAAEGILGALPDRSHADEQVGAEEFLAAANEEIESYRQQDPDISIYAEVRDDVSGVLVDGNALMISSRASVARRRMRALLHHEVGTHLVTQVNGSSQPVRLMGVGLANYDETQEGLAVLAEIACGGLTASRLRQLAARVVAVAHLTAGASFVETFRALREIGLSGGAAFATTMRVYRSGGFTKDAVYLRGMLDLLEHLDRGGSLDLLFLGKFSLEDLPLVEDLATRGLLAPARIMPRYLDDAGAVDRLRAAARSRDLVAMLA